MKLPHLPHAVSRLRSSRLARSTRPFLARGGPHGERCGGCRLILSHCLCALRPVVPTRAGVCLLMAEHETLKPSNTGWLIADVVPDTMAFGWARTVVDPALLALLADPQWQPYVVFPGEFVAPERVITHLLPEYCTADQCDAVDTDLNLNINLNLTLNLDVDTQVQQPVPASGIGSKRALFILLDATWPEARKIFKKSPYLNQFPVLSLAPEQLSRYRLRRSRRDDHLCTSEVAALCLGLAGDTLAAQTLEAYLDVFTDHYLSAKQQIKVDREDALHQRLYDLRLPV
jgi:DTW domain-containing protein YfiP